VRRLLVAIMGATTAVTVLAFVLPLSLFVRGIESRLRVEAVVDAATSLAAFVDDDVSVADIASGVARFETEHEDLDVVVYGRDGVAVGTELRPADPAVADAFAGERVVQRDDSGVTVYVPNNGPFGGGPSSYVVRVDATGDVLDIGARRLALVLVGSGAVAVVVGAAVGLLAARAISTPTLALTGTARRLRDGDLAARVEPSGPVELRELGETLNHLAARIEELLEHEREAAADIAHRLRTPLTALGLEIEALDDVDQAAALQERAVRLQVALDDVIADMRDVETPTINTVDVAAVVERRTNDWRDVAAATGRPFRVVLPADPCEVPLDAESFEAALDAVVGNAFTHTPPDAAIAVTVAQTHDDAVRVVVDDAGPGLPDGTVAARGRSGGGSTGLGLDIASRTAAAAGGSLELATAPTGGARVTMALPLVHGRRQPDRG